MQQMNPHGCFVTSLFPLPGDYVLAGCHDGLITCWNVVTGKLMRRVDVAKTERVWKVAVVAHDFRLIACSSDKVIHTWKAVPAKKQE
jgi:WD40 repeat protein